MYNYVLCIGPLIYLYLSIGLKMHCPTNYNSQLAGIAPLSYTFSSFPKKKKELYFSFATIILYWFFFSLFHQNCYCSMNVLAFFKYIFWVRLFNNSNYSNRSKRYVSGPIHRWIYKMKFRFEFLENVIYIKSILCQVKLQFTW